MRRVRERRERRVAARLFMVRTGWLEVEECETHKQQTDFIVVRLVTC